MEYFFHLLFKIYNGLYYWQLDCKVMIKIPECIQQIEIGYIGYSWLYLNDNLAGSMFN